MTPSDNLKNPAPKNFTSKTTATRGSHSKLRQFLSVVAVIAWTVGCILLAQLLLALLFRFLIANFHLYSPVVQTIYSVLTYVIAGAIIIFLPSWLSKKRKKTTRFATAQETRAKSAKTATAQKPTRAGLGLTGWPTWTDLGLAPIGFIVYVILAALIGGLFTLFPWFNATEAQTLGFSQFAIGFDRILAFFTLVIAAPVAEELIFRGHLYDKLKSILIKNPAKNSSKPHRAQTNASTVEISAKTDAQTSARTAKAGTKNHTELVAIIIASLLTSLVFAALHGQWNVGVNVFVMSLILCAMREITGTIYAGIIMHMIKNAVAFIMVFVIGNGLF